MAGLGNKGTLKIKPEHWPIILRHVASTAVICLTVAGMIWSIGKPWAQSQIIETVEQQGYAKASQLQAVQDDVRIIKEEVDAADERIENKIVKINDAQRRLERQQSATAVQIDNIEKLATEQRDFMFRLLQMQKTPSNR